MENLLKMNEIYNSILLYKQNEIIIIPNEADYFTILAELQKYPEFDLNLTEKITVKTKNPNVDVLLLFNAYFELAAIKTFLFENDDIEYFYDANSEGSIQVLWLDRKYPYRFRNMAHTIDSLIKSLGLSIYLKMQYHENNPNLFNLSLSNFCKSSDLNLIEIFSQIVFKPQEIFQLKQMIDEKLQRSRLAVIQNATSPLLPASPLYSSELSENEYNTGVPAFNSQQTPNIQQMLNSAFIVYMSDALHITPAYDHCDRLFEELYMTKEFNIINDDNRLIVSNLPEEKIDLRNKFLRMFSQARVYSELTGSDKVKYFYYGDPKRSIEVVYILLTTDKRDIREALATVLENTGLNLYLLLDIHPTNPLSFTISFKLPFNNYDNIPSLPGLLKIIIENTSHRNAMCAFLFQKYQADRASSNIPAQSFNTNTPSASIIDISQEDDPNQNEPIRKRKRYYDTPYRIHLQYSELNEKMNLNKSVNLKDHHDRVYHGTDMVYKNGVRVNPQFLPSIEWQDTYHKKGTTNKHRQAGTLNGDKVYTFTNWKSEYCLVYLTADDSYPKVNPNDYYKLLECVFNNTNFKFINDKAVGNKGSIRKWKRMPSKKEQFFVKLNALTDHYELVKPADYESRTSEDHNNSNNNNQTNQNPSDSVPTFAVPRLYPSQSTLYRQSRNARGPQHQPVGPTIDLTRSDYT